MSRTIRPQPIGYYPDPYPNYWYPTADLLRRRGDRRGLGRRRRLGRLGRMGRTLERRRHRHRLQQLLQQRDFNGKVNFNDVDWKNVDRSKINFDRDQLANFDRTNIKDGIKANGLANHLVLALLSTRIGG